MKKTTLALVCALVGLQTSVSQAQNSLPVPVVDRTPSSTSAAPAAPSVATSPATRTVMSGSQAANAELLMMVDQLQEEVRFLRGQLEEMAHQMKKMRTNQRDRYRDLDRRISGINRQLADVQTSPSMPLASSNTSSSIASQPTNVSPAVKKTDNSSAAVVDSPKAVPAPRVTDRQAYKEAFGLVRQRSFDKALTAFSDFLRIYPKSTLVPNVLYWTGEVYRAKPEAEQKLARGAYSQLVEQFPRHQKAADGYYKLGLSYALEGDEAQAKLMMQKVVDSYPSQSSAKLAQDYLNKVSKKK